MQYSNTTLSTKAITPTTVVPDECEMSVSHQILVM